MLFQLIATILVVVASSAEAIIFDGVTSLHVWLTVSSLVNKDASNHKSLIFRQIELNWINAPLDHEADYIGLYLDSEPSDRSMPVSVHRLAGQTNGHIITDYFLPQLDFLNETLNNNKDDLDSWKDNNPAIGSTIDRSMRWNDFNHNSKRHDPKSRTTNNSPLMSSSQCLGYCLAYHSRNKILASNCLRTNPTWMQDSFQYIGSRSLPSLMIPGSHNSATYPKLLDKSALNMLNKYQMNQDEPIFNQLVYGIRHLDLRVGYAKVKQRPERLWIYHDIFRTDVTVEDVLEQVRRFLNLTSHEVIIMDFHRFTVGFQNENQATQRERHSNLIEFIFKKLGPYIVPSYLGQHAPLNELIAAGKRLVVGYAARSFLLGSNELSILGLLSTSDKSINKAKHQVRDIDALRQDQEDSIDLLASVNKSTVPTVAKPSAEDQQQQPRVGSGSSFFNKFTKSLKLIGRTLSKRSPNSGRFLSPTDTTKDDHHPTRRAINDFEILGTGNNPITSSGGDSYELDSQNLAKVALFFPSVRHLWPDRDSLEGLGQYMNESTCRKYFGELSSMMVELTPTVFGAISDKYDGNRRLAQQVNRPVTDWIRDRWLHCMNIVASDYFLGNDLIQLSIYANKMRAHQSRNAHTLLSGAGVSEQCKSFKKIGHQLDKSKIPVQFTLHRPIAFDNSNSNDDDDDYLNNMFVRPTSQVGGTNRKENDIVHTSSDGNRIFLRPVKTHNQQHSSGGREKRDSIVDNFSDGFSNFFSSFKRLLNL